MALSDCFSGIYCKIWWPVANSYQMKFAISQYLKLHICNSIFIRNM